MKIRAQITDNNGRVISVLLDIPEISDVSDVDALDLAERIFASDVVAAKVVELSSPDPFVLALVEVTDLTRSVPLT